MWFVERTSPGNDEEKYALFFADLLAVQEQEVRHLLGQSGSHASYHTRHSGRRWMTQGIWDERESTYLTSCNNFRILLQLSLLQVLVFTFPLIDVLVFNQESRIRVAGYFNVRARRIHHRDRL